MPTFRNISNDDLVVQDGHRWLKVPVGGTVEVPKPGTYWQTGDTGEEPLWEVVGASPKSKGSAKATPSSNDAEKEI